MKIEVTITYYFIPTRLAKHRVQEIPNVGNYVEKWEALVSLVGIYLGINFRINILAVLRDLMIQVAHSCVYITEKFFMSMKVVSKNNHQFTCIVESLRQ